ncbi:hypothetical protein EDC28_10912 [Gallaecimonas pentaromativorans]|uniref:NUDIX domain-containing protein n=2 Tax=Gallaecimonas pentaromativorans TaxID=584787 RepID=A0A3N1P5W5_9GAMM|nr:hypothetical protein EDC28_10912 [Gallaecimonas pentaromativorans]
MGVFEHLYDDNFSGENFSTHYVVLALKVTVDPDDLALPIAQHSRYRWQSIDVLRAAQDVHQHSKWYFQGKDVLGRIE